MSVSGWPRVRLPVLGDGNTSGDNVIVEVPPARRNNTFSISYADQRPGSSARTPGSVIAPQRPILESSEGEGDAQGSEGESDDDNADRTRAAVTSTSTSRLRPAAGASSTSHPFQHTPHFSRTMSMPLPSRLSHLRHPHRPKLRPAQSSPITSADPLSHINSLSVELADAYQMVIQTMLQISPPQVLESAKEQYSACSLSIPTPSMSAMFTAMKTLNYMSANLLRFYSESGSLGYSDGEGKAQNVFDIGELLQGVGDTLSGVAAHAGVDLVLYHGEVGLRHVYVKGDECGISYALLHIIRQILDRAHAGDLIELGLVVTPHGVQSETPSLRDEGVEGRVTASPVDMESLRCTIKIEHRYGAGASGYSPDSQDEDQDVNGEISLHEKRRANPQFPSPLLRRLLRLIDAQFTIADKSQDGQTYELSLILNKTASSVSKAPVPLSGSGMLEEFSGSDAEPSVEQLLAFGETLRSRKVTLYANSASAFTRHITNYLTAWSMDVSHVFSDSSSETSMDDGVSAPVAEARFSPAGTPATIPSEATSTGTSRPTGSENQPQISFVLIDDDVGILRERLHALRVEQHPLNLNARARPSLAALHRPRSSPQIARVIAQSTPTRPPVVVILHFTSLANFKATKDVVQSVVSTYTGSAAPMPEIMIIPKPVGPRRFITAIHTAVTRPTIDPFFLPTATSPGTPSTQLPGSFFPAPSDPNSNNPSPQSGSPFNRTPRPHSSRSNSDRSMKEHIFTSLPSPSPLGIPDNTGYFPDPAGKLGASPSSGYLVSSPDGQPAGILFHPRSKKNASPQPVERVGNQTNIQRRGSIPRLFSGTEKDSISFSALLEASHTPEAVVEAKSVVGTPTGSASAATRDVTSTPGRRSPPESPGSENGPSKRALVKRPTHEKQDSTGKNVTKKGKSTISSADGNIVPPISVLIVDDNPINQTILSTFMKRKKIRYDIANNGMEAVEKWKTGGFHLILMDIQMPIMDGIEATREIRRLEEANASSEFLPITPSQITFDALIPSSSPASDTRSTTASSPYRSSVIIVALTASSLQSDRVNALAAGCNDFLTKPVSLLWLNNKIIEWGSIKALQMWADIRPEAVRKMSRGQAAQARAVADRLHMPKRVKSPSRRPSVTEQNVPATDSGAPATANSDMNFSVDVPKTPGFTDVVNDGLANATNNLDSGTEEWTPLPPIMPPKRRRSQKRESAPESSQSKSINSSESAHVASRSPLSRVNNGVAATATVQDEHVQTDVVPPKAGDEDPKENLQQTQEPRLEAPEPLNITPPPRSPILRPR
ncbi:hypothetical protein P691DRAFT_774601 [Macrolepiota fuliginosa MF-IS2]|uniref:Response regulatory domain-containing protein n=1 Tax=Macrolepiota fuliginosa MF-IS2 TaxID=1400762 RepID=A0A9P5XHY5_9AGAR|nr:hypothetical protein P691DRAFT_774601 [Macrolepiota fuliginosa MF-IS2]